MAETGARRWALGLVVREPWLSPMYRRLGDDRLLAEVDAVFGGESDDLISSVGKCSPVPPA